MYSKSGKDPDFPPLAAAFGKIDRNGPDTLENSWLNLHPNCLHQLRRWTPMGRSEEEIRKIKDFSSFQKNPVTRDPRTKKQIEAYRKKEEDRARFLRDHRQWVRYRETIGDPVPKSFKTFQKHKYAVENPETKKRSGDEKFTEWQKAYRFAVKRERFSALIGTVTSTGVSVTGVSDHIVDQAIARGFTAESVLDALQNPVKVGKIRTDESGASQRFTGEAAAVVINPETGNLITGWRKK